MAKKAKVARAGRQDPHGTIPPVRVLLSVALAISVYLVWVSLTDSGVPGCGPESGCDRVLRSRWSSWLGIPVSLPALLVYSVALVMSFRLKPPTPVAARQRAWAVLILCAVAILGAVVWFVVLQVVVIGAFCPYCMVAHVAAGLAAVLILVKAPIRSDPGKRRQGGKQTVIPPATAGRLCLVSLAGVALLVGGQLLHRPAGFRVTTLDTDASSASATHAAVASSSGRPQPEATGQVTNPPPRPAEVPVPAHRTLTFHRGAIRLDLGEVPILGSPNAPVVIVNLRDYSCHFCRDMHGKLLEVYRALSNQVAIVSLPMPLNTNCNFVARRTPRDHENSCEYARLALGVWRARADKMEQFDEWILAPEHPPAPEVVEAYAERLVGTNALLQALADPWIERQLHVVVSLYATNALNYRQTRMPQTFIGKEVIVGTVNSAQDIYSILARQGAEPPAGVQPKGN